MAESKSKFIIQEIPKKSGPASESGVSFEWSAANFSAPQGGWEYAVALRTSRTEYPGSDIVSEQVLGSHFEPFDLKGIWLNRHNGGSSSNFAETTRVAFEAMVRRGNLVKITFDEIVIYGLITNFKPKYFTKWKIGYQFTVSPHYRNPQGDMRPGTSLAPKPTDNPDSYQQKLDDAVQKAINSLHGVAPSVYTVGNVYQTVANVLSALQDRSDTLRAVVDNRVLVVNRTLDPTNQGSSSLARLVQGFQSMRDTAATLLTITADASAVTGGSDPGISLAICDIVMSYEVWIRETREYAREIVLQADQAAKDLASQAAPDAQALYRPLAGESLYGISTRFYGTPDRWRDVYDRNQLVSFDLTGLELLVIPERAPGV